MPRHLLAGLVALALGATLAAQNALPPDVLLKQAMQREQVDGDLEGAAALYQKIADAHADQAAVASEALGRLAAIRDRQDRGGEARVVYSRILERYPTSAAAATARGKLAAKPVQAARLSRREIDVPRRLAELGRVSPDGTWLSFNDVGLGESSGNLGVWRIGTSEIRMVTNHECCAWAEGFAKLSAWSRDGRQLAYTWHVSRVGESLRVVPLGGGGARVLLANTEETRRGLGMTHEMAIQPFDWSKDGTWILAGLGQWVGPGTRGFARLVRISAADGNISSLVELGERGFPENASLSPDDRFIAFDHVPAEGRSGRDVFIVPTAGGEPRALAGEAASVDEVIGWTSDGEHLLYSSNIRGTNDVMAVPMSGGRPSGPARLLESSVGAFRTLGLTADGRAIVTQMQPRSDVYVADIEAATGRFATSPRPLPRAQAGTRHQATWSPDGRRVAFFHRTPLDVQTLVVQDTATGAARSYPLSARNPERPVWRPDGRAIAFNAVGDNEPQTVFLLDLESGGLERLAASVQVAFSPDGRYLYYPAREAPGATYLVRREMASGREDVVHRQPALGTALVLSPDGSTFASFVPAARGGGLSVVVFPADGGQARTLVTDLPALANEVAWSPDGRYLYVATNPRTPERLDAAIWRVPVDGGKPEQVGAAPWPAWVRHLSVAPDGRLAVSVIGTDIELWAWENLRELIRSRTER